jgi:hypothetical protein
MGWLTRAGYGNIDDVDALTLLKDQAANADAGLMRVFEPVTPDQAVWKLPGSAANTIGVTFLHAYLSEDEAVQRLRAAPSLFESGGWRERLGYDPAGWTTGDRPDLAQFKTYAQAVTAASQGYLSGLRMEDLDREIETPRGKRPLVQRLSVYLVYHKFQHMGDIAALMGCQGVRGLPV